MNWRRLLTVVGLGIFVWYVSREWPHLKSALLGIRELSSIWIVALLLLVSGFYCLTTLATQTSLRFFQQSFAWRQLLAIGLESVYLNSIVPSGGLAGISPLLERAEEQHAKHKIASGYIMTTSLIVLSLVLLWLGLTLESWYRIGLVGLLIGIVLVLRRLGGRPRLAADAFLWACLANTVQFILMYLLFQAMDYPVAFSEALFVYSASMIAWYISPTPQGLGAFELAASSSLTKVGLPAGAALAIPLTYRAFVQLLPMLTGGVSYTLRRWRSHTRPSSQAVEA